LIGTPIAPYFGMFWTQRSVPEAIQNVLDEADSTCLEAEQTIRAVTLQMRHRVPWPDRRHPQRWSEHDFDKRDAVAPNRTDEMTRWDRLLGSTPEERSIRPSRAGVECLALPAQTPCVHCGVSGFVRQEHVITGQSSIIQFYCGHCDHSWRVPDRRSEPRQAADQRPDKPNHSR
jgi:hypothetical protein